MDWLWTWGGECFGYRMGDKLLTYNGVQIGRFDGDEVYGTDGRYLGEVKSHNRLITNLAKKHHRHSRFAPSRSGSYCRYANYVGYTMYAGYEDFPSPDEFSG